ncbi:hypothetical protein [Arthrobacter sp. MYb213]|uniref:hypothetical protein n=1 Tax=Arthrobacter sp. MYb213 TaxID=1848595 RepID=UPI000CFCD78F|nr:hypothetical protein [Arthrobacter sp. MYb213]PRB72506.1 hypothetical protein CQ011_02300 [Arthrobacter sp. MYb213]
MQSINMPALTQEANNAVQLAEAGLKLLEEMKDQHYDSAGMFACLALAAEKLIKIAYGLGTHYETGEWPAKKIKAFSHKLDELEPKARRFITSHQATERNKR